MKPLLAIKNFLVQFDARSRETRKSQASARVRGEMKDKFLRDIHADSNTLFLRRDARKSPRQGSKMGIEQAYPKSARPLGFRISSRPSTGSGSRASSAVGRPQSARVPSQPRGTWHAGSASNEPEPVAGALALASRSDHLAARGRQGSRLTSRSKIHGSVGESGESSVARLSLSQAVSARGEQELNGDPYARYRAHHRSGIQSSTVGRFH